MCKFNRISAHPSPLVDSYISIFFSHYWIMPVSVLLKELVPELISGCCPKAGMF